VDLPLVVASYLLGSVSFPWIVAWWHGIDLRAVGSHKLGGGNLTSALGLRWGAIGGVLDALKGAVAVWTAARFGLPVEMQVLCALAVVAGQMWPIFHDLDGGRANSTGWGALVALDIRAALVAALVLGAAAVARVGVRPPPTRIVPVAALLTFVVWCAVVRADAGPGALVVGGLAILALVLVRRITAGLTSDLATGAPLWPTLVDRALFDRSALQEQGVIGI
jgi:acyl phosphate:glycerol-3-phosphate acyltransferase